MSEKFTNEEKRERLEEWENCLVEAELASKKLADACTNVYLTARDRNDDYAVFKWNGKIIKFGTGYYRIIENIERVPE